MHRVFSTSQLRSIGLSDREVSRAVDCCLERVARGRFALRRRCENERHRRIWEAADEPGVTLLAQTDDFRDMLQRLKVLIRARADRISSTSGRKDGDSVCEVFSHISAALLWGLEVSRPVQERVEVMRPGVSRKYTNLIVRRRTLPTEQVSRIGDVTVTSLPRTLIDVARAYSLDVSVPMLDDALRRDLVTKDELLEAVEETCEVRNGKSVLTALEVMDSRRESPAESVVAVRLFENRIPGFGPQGEIADEWGRFVARVDFLHRGAKVIIEFDGRAKYFLDDRDHRAAFDRERERERKLRALGYHVVRIFWKDLFRPQKFTELARLVNSRLASAPAT